MTYKWTTIELIARQMADDDGDDYMEFSREWDRRARSALKALRKPSDEMIANGDVEILAYLNDGRLISNENTPAHDCFVHMIDTALQETNE